MRLAISLPFPVKDGTRIREHARAFFSELADQNNRDFTAQLS